MIQGKLEVRVRSLSSSESQAAEAARNQGPLAAEAQGAARAATVARRWPGTAVGPTAGRDSMRVCPRLTDHEPASHGERNTSHCSPGWRHGPLPAA
jgi:hypothetical protein